VVAIGSEWCVGKTDSVTPLCQADLRPAGLFPIPLRARPELLTEMTMPTLTERAHDDEVGSPPTPDRPQRRRFTAEYKLAVLAEYDGLEANGEKGAMLRREGLHTSHLAEWRRARGAGALHRAGTSTASSRPSPAGESASLAKANRRVARLEAELAKNRLALEIMGKAHALVCHEREGYPVK
jgi:transposase